MHADNVELETLFLIIIACNLEFNVYSRNESAQKEMYFEQIWSG